MKTYAKRALRKAFREMKKRNEIEVIWEGIDEIEETINQINEKLAEVHALFKKLKAAKVSFSAVLKDDQE